MFPGQVRAQLQPCSFGIGKVLDIGQGRDGDALAQVGQPLNQIGPRRRVRHLRFLSGDFGPQRGHGVRIHQRPL